MMGGVNMRPKTFDCMRMKRQGTDQVMKQLEGKSFQEQLEYWQKGTEDLKKLQQELKKTRGHQQHYSGGLPAQWNE